jgi:hypothetical protein
MTTHNAFVPMIMEESAASSIYQPIFVVMGMVLPLSSTICCNVAATPGTYQLYNRYRITCKDASTVTIRKTTMVMLPMVTVTACIVPVVTHVGRVAVATQTRVRVYAMSHSPVHHAVNALPHTTTRPAIALYFAMPQIRALAMAVATRKAVIVFAQAARAVLHATNVSPTTTLIPPVTNFVREMISARGTDPAIPRQRCVYATMDLKAPGAILTSPDRTFTRRT